MLKDKKCSVILCLAGSLFSAGLKKIVVDMHENDKDASGVTLADPFKVTQTDMSLFAGAMAFGTQLSASYRKNLGYSKTLNPTDAEPQKVGIEGSLINGVGYVNQSWNARLDWVSFPMPEKPILHYTEAMLILIVYTGKRRFNLI